MAETPAGMSRRELWIDARDLQNDGENPLAEEEYAALLTARGREKLAEKQLVRSFSAAVRTVGSAYQYGEDFQLGDTITVHDERLGVTVDAVVESVQRSVSREGETLEFSFGYGPPTIADILKRKAEK